ncbi:MAG: hypothetical protein LUC45_08110 [Paraprevotella sp.]|nr:hypothetical protein [Paraprevotella sp.]
MKLKTLMFVTAWTAAQAVAAQTPYTNENFMPTDLIGTARYVGMGGALGALGADMSAVSSNPAALGLYRKSDASLSFSVLTQKDQPDLKADKTHMSFDQMGFVVSVPIMGKSVKYVNFGANFQKRANFNYAFIADNPNINGLSQTQQMADILNNTTYSTPLADLMYNAYVLNPIYNRDDQGQLILDEKGNPTYDKYKALQADQNQYDRVTEGGISGYDFNVSTNIKDRVYLGFTLGVNDVDYYSYTTYREFGTLTNTDGSQLSGQEYYSLYNTQHVSGYGVNVKLGSIIRPIENSPFRIGIAVETPTFYHLESYSDYSIESPMYEDQNYDVQYGDKFNTYMPDKDLANLHMKITTPWKARISLGHTIGKYLAIGAEYEYANYSKTKQGYEDWAYDDWGYGYSNGGTKDPSMNAINKATLKGVHSFKFGFELNLTDQIAFRAGYNYYSSMFNKDATLDQTGPSPAFGYQTTTDYMNKGDVNIFTLGLGYRGRHFYADMAYKFRRQSGDFYAFDDTYIATESTGRLSPIDVHLNTHQVFFTVGYKF